MYGVGTPKLFLLLVKYERCVTICHHLSRGGYGDDGLSTMRTARYSWGKAGANLLI